LSENNGHGPIPQNPEGAAPAAGEQPKPDLEVESTASERAEGPSASPAELQRELEKVRAELEESMARGRTTQQRLTEEHERLLRTAAEFENFKRRAQKEKDDARKFGNESLLKDFLPVADNLDRAIEHAGGADPKHIIEGVKLVQKLLESTLARYGVAGFSAVGQPFDPNVHEALMQLESDAAPGTVVQEMAKGYKLHDRLIRPAAVVVARPKQPTAAGSPTPAPDGSNQG
jgi:molecular chaperone GrpE